MQCKVCQHPKRAAIDELLRSDHPYRDIAERYGISRATLGHHRSDHLALPPRPAGGRSRKQCTICNHSERIEIDAMIRERCPYPAITQRFEVSRNMIYEHRTKHLGIKIEQARCAVCRDERRLQIDEMLVSGMKIVEVTRTCGISVHLVGRHRSLHLGLEPLQPSQCIACTHERRAHIERDLIAGVSGRKVARKYGIPWESARRHYRNHLRPELAQERDSVIAEVMAAEEAQRRASSRLTAFLARPEAEAGAEATAIIESSRSILQRRVREAAREAALAEDVASRARERCRTAEGALQKLELADTELAQRRLAREMAESRAKSG